MTDPVRVTDVGDARLADYAALTDAALRKRYEHRLGVLIAEGPNPVRELVASPYPVRSVLVSEERLESVGDAIGALEAPVYVVTRELLYELVRFRLHQGVLACGARLPLPSAAELLRSASRVLVLEGLNDHENLGALFRSARAFGIDAVLVGPGCADPLYRRSVRVSMGHVLRVPFAVAGDLTAMFGALRAAGFTTYGLTPDAAAVDLREVATDGQRLAVVLGAEGPGLSASARAGVDLEVRIAMHPEVDSLNVAAAGAIALHAFAPGPDARARRDPT